MRVIQAVNSDVRRFVRSIFLSALPRPGSLYISGVRKPTCVRAATKLVARSSFATLDSILIPIERLESANDRRRCIR